MEMMKAKVFLSSTGDVHLRHKVIQVITKSGAYEPGQVRLYVFIPLPHFFLEQFRARRIVIMETINAQSTKRTVGSFEAFCLFILLLFTHTHFPVHIISLPHPHFMDLSLHPHFPVHLEF
jgi:hypothetical protein